MSVTITGGGICSARDVKAPEPQWSRRTVHISGLEADGEPVPEEIGTPQLLAVTVAA
jgi:hypothetical protein